MKKILIIGYGSIGRKHADILSKLIKNSEIYILTKQKKSKYKTVNTIRSLKSFHPDYIVLSKPTNQHEKYLNLIESNFSRTKVLVEKPAYVKNREIKLKKNYYYVGYNLRFHPVIKTIKKIVSNKKIWNVNISCTSFLPNWRKSIEYHKSSSARKNLKGGVLFDLSHELNYLIWIFGLISIKFISYKKLSDLNINTKDSLVILGNIRKTQVLVNLNFLSKIEKREIIINGKDFHLIGDIIKNEIRFFKNKKLKKISFNKYNNTDSYKNMHKEILFNKEKKLVCTLKDSFRTLNLIKEIKSHKND